MLKSLLKPINVMAGTKQVRTYNEWTELLQGDFGKSIKVKW